MRSKLGPSSPVCGEAHCVGSTNHPHSTLELDATKPSDSHISKLSHLMIDSHSSSIPYTLLSILNTTSGLATTCVRYFARALSTLRLVVPDKFSIRYIKVSFESLMSVIACTLNSEERMNRESATIINKKGMKFLSDSMHGNHT